MLDTLSRAALELPEKVISLIPPRPSGVEFSRELFGRRTGVAFDALAPAETAANLTVGLILHPDRAARLVEHHMRVPEQPSFASVVQALLAATWMKEGREAHELQRTVERVVLYHLMNLVAREQASPQARAVARNELSGLQQALSATVSATVSATGRADGMHTAWAADAITRFLKDPTKVTVVKPLEAPPGAPI